MNFRNILAFGLAISIFPGLWAAQGAGVIELPQEVLGVTIVLETLIVQFYFRKKEGESNNGK